MRTFFPSDSCKESQLNAINPQSWLQVERGKLSKLSSSHTNSSSIESFIKVPEPPILPFFKPIDYVEVLAQIHEEMESCSPQERSTLYLLQFQIFRGLGETKLMRRSLRSAWQRAGTVHEKLVFGAWLRYEKQGEELIADLLATCNKCAQEFGPVDVSQLQVEVNGCSKETVVMNGDKSLKNVNFKIGDEIIVCDRQKIASLSAPFHAMLNGYFTESSSQDIDLSENNISPLGMRTIGEFSITGSLSEVHPDLLLEILVFSNKFCCERLKDACDRKLASLVCTKDDAVEFMEYAIEQNSPVLAASCLQVFLHELPDCLNDERVVEIFSHADRQQRSIMVGRASFSLYCLLSEVAMNLDPRSDKTVCLLEQLIESAETDREKLLAFHQLGCVRLLRKEYDEAE
ncbi:hypothetical protein Goari_013830, partial [Gossypium aridum]|nr:hypothetical protein [Gossypium aridum]